MKGSVEDVPIFQGDGKRPEIVWPTVSDEQALLNRFSTQNSNHNSYYSRGRILVFRPEATSIDYFVHQSVGPMTGIACIAPSAFLGELVELVFLII